MCIYVCVGTGVLCVRAVLWNVTVPCLTFDNRQVCVLETVPNPFFLCVWKMPRSPAVCSDSWMKEACVYTPMPKKRNTQPFCSSATPCFVPTWKQRCLVPKRLHISSPSATGLRSFTLVWVTASVWESVGFSGGNYSTLFYTQIFTDIKEIISGNFKGIVYMQWVKAQTQNHLYTERVKVFMWFDKSDIWYTSAYDWVALVVCI